MSELIFHGRDGTDCTFVTLPEGVMVRLEDDDPDPFIWTFTPEQWREIVEATRPVWDVPAVPSKHTPMEIAESLRIQAMAQAAEARGASRRNEAQYLTGPRHPTQSTDFLPDSLGWHQAKGGG